MEKITEKAIELRRAYYREYRQKNPEKVAACERRYWERKAIEGGRNPSDWRDMRRAHVAEYRRAHPEKVKEYEARRWNRKAEMMNAEQT